MMPPSRHARRGLSLPEAMLSLSITTMLLIAVAGAYSGSASVIEMNDRFFRATQAARVAMTQMTSEVRQCDSVQVYSDHLDIIRPSQTITANEVYRRFAYDATGLRITLQIFYTNGVTSQVYTLASGVTGATFGPADMSDDQNNALVAVRVPLSVTVTIGANQITLSGSAAPRRAQTH